jgi:hypothetical protein
MKSDRELLELAANAAGIEHTGAAFHPIATQNFQGLYIEEGQIWNPLTHDGDALRLAVKLRIELVGVVNDAFGDPFVLVHGRNRKEFTEVVEDAELSLLATRRAIVRAAAEIGKGIK